MSDAVILAPYDDAPTSRYSAPVGAEWVGRARDFRRRVAADDEVYGANFDAVINPVIARLERYPQRSLRPETLTACLRDWMMIPAREFRLNCDGKMPTKNRASLVERRLTASKTLRDAWDEADISITELRLDVAKNNAVLATRVLAIFSLHAIGRFFQRTGSFDDARLLDAMTAVADALTGESKLVVGAGYRVRTDKHGGGFRGRVIPIHAKDGTMAPTLAIRTWLPE